MSQLSAFLASPPPGCITGSAAFSWLNAPALCHMGSLSSNFSSRAWGAAGFGASTPFSYTTGVAAHLLLAAPPTAPFPQGCVGAALGGINGSGLLCRGPGDPACSSNETQCCRINWSTAAVASLSTPPFDASVPSLCSGAAWCVVPLSVFALPPAACSPYYSSANTSIALNSSDFRGSPFGNSSAVRPFDPATSPLLLQLNISAGDGVLANGQGLYLPSVYPPMNLSSSIHLVDGTLPTPAAPAFAGGGLLLDLAPNRPLFLPAQSAQPFPACTGLCLSQQCPGFASLQSCIVQLSSTQENCTLPSLPCYVQPRSSSNDSKCAWGFGASCTSCAAPTQALCPGGKAVVVQPGFWMPESLGGAYDLSQLVACSPPLPAERCTGTPNIPPLGSRPPACALGYTGDACGACSEGFFLSSDPAQCTRCPGMANYTNLALIFIYFACQLLAFATLVFFALFSCLLCRSSAHRALPRLVLLRFLLLSLLQLLLWVVVFSQQASLLFSGVQELTVAQLRSVFELLAVLQFRGISAPNSQCLSVPFPFLWASTFAVWACYLAIFSAVAAARLRCGSPGGAAGAARCGLLRQAAAALPRGAAFLLALAYGTLTNVFVSTVTCEQRVTMPLSQYRTLGGDGSSLLPADFSVFNASSSGAPLLGNQSVSVSLLAANPYQICLEGNHIPAFYASIVCLVCFTVAFPLLSLAVLRARGTSCFTIFCVPAQKSARGVQRRPCRLSCYFCRERSQLGSTHRLIAMPPAPPLLVAAAAFAGPPSALQRLHGLLSLPDVRQGFIPLHQLALSSTIALLALPRAIPSASLPADIALVLLTSAAAASIKLHFRPFQSSDKWRTSTLFIFYSLTAFTAVMLAVVRNTSHLPLLALWTVSILPILGGIVALLWVLYKWTVALYRVNPASLTRQVDAPAGPQVSQMWQNPLFNRASGAGAGGGKRPEGACAAGNEGSGGTAALVQPLHAEGGRAMADVAPYPIGSMPVVDEEPLQNGTNLAPEALSGQDGEWGEEPQETALPLDQQDKPQEAAKRPDQLIHYSPHRPEEGGVSPYLAHMVRRIAADAAQVKGLMFARHAAQRARWRSKE